MIKISLVFLSILFSLNCQLLDNSVNGRYRSEAPPHEGIAPPTSPTFAELGLSVKSSVLGIISVIDELTGTVRFNNLPGGRFVSINFNDDDLTQAPLSCLNLPSYVSISYGSLSLETPLANSAKLITLKCLYQNVDITLELQVQASSIALISSSSFQGKSSGVYTANPQITDDGKWVVFESSGFTLSGGTSIFIKNLDTGALVLVSSSDGILFENGNSASPQITPDGNWVVFRSDSTNLVLGAGGSQIFLKNLSNLSTPPILLSSIDSLAADQTNFRGDSYSYDPQITPDGKWCIFMSFSSNLILGAGGGQIFLKDLQNLSSPPILLSSIDSLAVDQTSSKGDGNSLAPQITPNGRWAVFESDSSNFVLGAGGDQIYLKDLNSLSAAPILLSSIDTLAGDQTNFLGNRNSSDPQITPDGRWIVFMSDSSNLALGAGGSFEFHIFLKDTNNLSSPPILVSSTDSLATDHTNFKGNSNSKKPQITSDGRWVVFSSYATNFISNSGVDGQIYLKDLAALRSPPVLLSSIDPSRSDQSNFRGDNDSDYPQITPDGKKVVFRSKSKNFVPGSAGSLIYLKDLNDISSSPILLSTIESLPVDQASFKGDGQSSAPQITPDRRSVVFSSYSSNLFLGASKSQIYFKDINNPSALPLVVSSIDSSKPDQKIFIGNDTSTSPQITPNSRWVVFSSESSNFVVGAGGSQIYLKDLNSLSSPPILLSSINSLELNQGFFKGNLTSKNPQITPDGRWVIFSSKAFNLVTGANGDQIYLKDTASLSSPPILLSSLNSLATNQSSSKGDGSSDDAQITPDGRWVVFESKSLNLVLGAGGSQIYLKDLNSLGSPPILLSSLDSMAVDQTNFMGDGNSYDPQITPDGKWVVFSSGSSNLVLGASGTQVYLKDLNSLSSAPLLLSSIDSLAIDQTNFRGNSSSTSPQITPDGQWVVFVSSSSNLVSGADSAQVYLKDINNLSSRPVLLSSIDSSEPDQTNFKGDGSSLKPQITADGGLIIFESISSNLVLGASGYQIYLKDRNPNP